MVVFQGKRGAIELSMNTIIIVVIGITILTLGLRWIYGIFGGLEEQQQSLERLSEEQINDLIGGSSEQINLPASNIKVAHGKKHNLRLVIQNVLSNTHTFKYSLEVDSVPGGTPEQQVMSKLNWYKKDITLKSAEGFKDFISFDTSKLPLGTYRFRIVLNCIDCSGQEDSSAPLIVEVMPK